MDFKLAYYSYKLSPKQQKIKEAFHKFEQFNEKIRNLMAEESNFIHDYIFSWTRKLEEEQKMLCE